MSVDHERESDRELNDEERAAKMQELMDSEPLPLIEQSIDAFRHDLPELLQKHHGKWVGYHGEERFGFGTSETAVYQLAFAGV